jgi:anti-sigma regulatory factor (Ser/Thr protein kinase)
MLVANVALRSLAAPRPTASWPLGHDDLSPARARHLAAGQLTDWGLADLVDTVQLLISEVVTNAVRYAPGPIQLSLRLCSSTLRCEVEDASPEAPRRRAAHDESEGGRGLALVDALTDTWRSSSSPTGKTTWFELSLSSHPEAEAGSRRAR